MKIQRIQSNSPEIIEAIGRFRVAVWRSEETMKTGEFGDADSWTDSVDFAPQTHHWVVYHEGEIVASARMSIHQDLNDVPYAAAFKRFGIEVGGKIASLNRMLVARAFRGRGIAHALDLARVQMAKSLGAEAILVLSLGPLRRRSLMRLGFWPVAIDVEPSALGLPYENATLNVMRANLPLAGSNHIFHSDADLQPALRSLAR